MVCFSYLANFEVLSRRLCEEVSFFSLKNSVTGSCDIMCCNIRIRWRTKWWNFFFIIAYLPPIRGGSDNEKFRYGFRCTFYQVDLEIEENASRRTSIGGYVAPFRSYGTTLDTFIPDERGIHSRDSYIEAIIIRISRVVQWARIFSRKKNL